jgi:hypothetical protein
MKPEHQALWRELCFGQNVMNKAAEETPIAILQRMDVDKTEGGRRRLEHRIKCSLSHPLVRGDRT